MHGIRILLVSVLVPFTQGTNSSLFANWQSSWIIGGTDVAPGELPYMVSIRRVVGNPPESGGSIISNWYILTAAHSVSRKLASALRVVVGTTKLDSTGQRFTISRIIIHDGFLHGGAINDIALLKLTEPIVYSAKVQPIALPNQNAVTAPGTVCLISGWGSTELCEVTVSNKLQKLQVTIVHNTECEKHYNKMPDTMMCATAGPGKSPSKADSGAPLICGGEQIGILYGAGTRQFTCPIGLPSAYTRVSKYISWITHHAV